MTTISKNALVPFSAAMMYKLVDDIDAYPEFLPWCRGTQVISRNVDEVEASIDISHSGISKSFTTRNRLQINKMIEVRLVEGPFRHLEGFWRFDPLGDDACKVCLDLEFDFSNKLLSMAFGPVFNQIANSMVDSFTKRAMNVYRKD